MAILTPTVVDLTISFTAAINVSMIIIMTATVIPAVTFVGKAAATLAYTVVADLMRDR